MKLKTSHLLTALAFLSSWALIEGLIVAAAAEDAISPLAAWYNVGVLAPVILILTLIAAPLLALWPRVTPARAALHMLTSDEPASAHPAIAALLCAPPLLVVPTLATLLLGQPLLTAIKTPAFIIAAICLLWAALALITTCAAPLLYLPAAALVRRLSATRLKPYLTPLHALALLALLGALALLAASIILRKTIALTPWWIPAAPLLSLLLTAPLALLKPKRAPHAALTIAALLLLLTAAAYLPPAPLQPHRAVWAGQTSVANLWAERVESWTDWDEDGASALLGGGDCAPDNPAISPTARDLPNNRVDEDCDGHDFIPASLALPRGQTSHPVPPNAPRRPHIILITTDALSWRHTTPGGYKKDITPNLNKLSKEALTFQNAFSASSSTRLSLPAILVGKYNSQLLLTNKRVHPYGWDASVLTLAERLSQRGWSTAQIVSDHYFTSANWPGYQQGFQRIVTAPIQQPKDKEHTAPEVSDEIIKIINEEHTKPLFLWAHYYDHHAPYISPYDPKGKKSPVEHYDDEVRATDAQWGRVFEAIQRRWRPDEYILIFTADHGERFDGQFQHGTNIDSTVLDIPLIIQTAHQRGTTRQGLVTQLDIVPTIANLIQSPVDAEWPGESLLPVIFEGEEPEKAIVFSLHYIPEAVKNKKDGFFMIGARTKDWYYVEDLRKRQQNLYTWSPAKVDALAAPEQRQQQLSDLRYTTIEMLDWLRKRERALKRP